LKTEEFDSVWKILEESKVEEAEPGILIRRITPDFDHDFFLACEKPRNRRMFLLRVNKQNSSKFRQLPAFKSFEIAVVSVPEDLDKFVTFGFILSDPIFSDFFSTLCTDIYLTADGEKNQIKMIASIKNRLLMWKQFLDIYGFQGLSSEYQRGLYGELRFIHDVLIPLVGPENAISSWRGPSRGNQDFQFAGIGIEIKTSIAKLHQKIPIASEQQLDDSGLKALFLYHLSIKEINEDGETLPGIIDKIREIICSQSGPLQEFEIQLFKAGYLDNNRPMYEKRGYSDRGIHIFRVNDKFPRIIESDLKNGIGDVHYSINLSACIPFVISREEFTLYLEKILHGQ
jgi:hypothetical protein